VAEGIILPLTLAPLWMRGVAANPLAFAMDAARALRRPARRTDRAAGRWHDGVPSPRRPRGILGVDADTSEPASAWRRS
jgi:hypothetical protein